MRTRTSLLLCAFIYMTPNAVLAELHDCNGMWTNKPCDQGAGKQIQEKPRPADAPAEAVQPKPEPSRQSTAVASSSSATAEAKSDEEEDESKEDKNEKKSPLPKAGLLAMFGSYPLRSGNAVDSDGGIDDPVVGRLAVRGDDCEYSVTNTSESDSFKLDLSLETLGKGDSQPKKTSFSANLPAGESKSFKRQCRGVVSGALMLRGASRN